MLPIQLFNQRGAFRNFSRVPRTGILTFLIFLAALVMTMTAAAANYKVTIQGDAFDPSDLTILAGDTVTWINESAGRFEIMGGMGCVPDGSLSSGFMGPGAIFSREFAMPGYYLYFGNTRCFMRMEGSVTVSQRPRLACDVVAQPVKGPAPLEATFLPQTSGGSRPYIYSWTFGDGFSSSEEEVWYSYTLPGTYQWELSVTDGSGAVCTRTGTIEVSDAR